MFCKYMLVDDDRNLPLLVDATAGVVLNPSWSIIEDAIGSLDGDHVRLVLISEHKPTSDSGLPYGGRALGIGGGGQSGLYTCKYFENDEEFGIIDPENPDEQYVDILCGELTSVQVRCCVPLHKMLSIVKLFAVDGDIDMNYHWLSYDGRQLRRGE